MRPLRGTEVLAVRRRALANPLVHVADVELDDRPIGHGRLHRGQVDQHVLGVGSHWECPRCRLHFVGRHWQARGAPRAKPAVEDPDLRISQMPQEHVAAARLAEAGVHGLLVHHGGLLARESCLAERSGKGVPERREALRRALRQIGEHLPEVDRARNVPFGELTSVTRIDEDDLFRRHQGVERRWRNRVLHVSCQPPLTTPAGSRPRTSPRAYRRSRSCSARRHPSRADARRPRGGRAAAC